MNIPGLDIKSQYKGQTRYEGAVLTVSAVSKYNDTQIAFTEIDGFWQLPESYHNRKPPIGTVAKFFLKTKPKVNDPSKFYMDIEGIEKADGEPIAQQPSYEQPQGDPRDEYVAPQAQSKDNYWDAKDIRIAKAQATNILSDILTSGDTVNAPKIIARMGFSSTEEAIDAVALNWNRLRNGLSAFADDEEQTEWENPAEELDQQAAQHLSEQQPEFQSTPEHNVAQQPTWEAQGAGGQPENVEEIPW